MRVVFPYAREKSGLLGNILRPVARIVLNRSFPHIMYIDSGADITLLPRSVGKLIGLEEQSGEKPEKVYGVGDSSVHVFIRRVSMKIGKAEFSARVAWSTAEDVPLLLGRLDVFRRFRIVFDERRGNSTFYT